MAAISSCVMTVWQCVSMHNETAAKLNSGINHFIIHTCFSTVSTCLVWIKAYCVWILIPNSSPSRVHLKIQLFECITSIHFIYPWIHKARWVRARLEPRTAATVYLLDLLPAFEPGLRLLKVVSEEQIQGSHAVLQSQRQVWPRAPGEPKQTQNLVEKRKKRCWKYMII